MKKINYWPIVGIIILLAVWRICCFFISEMRLPKPEIVFSKFIVSFFSYPKLAFVGGGKNGFAPHIIYTLTNVMVGTMIGSIAGIGMGLLMGWSRKVLDIFEPVINLVRSIPSLAIVPLIIIFLGYTQSGHLFLVVLYCFFMVVINVLNAMRNIEPTFIESSYTLGANRSQVFKKVVMPAVMPEVIGGIRVALGVGWSMAVVAELMGSRYGIGKLYMIFIPYFDIVGIFIGILWVLLFAIGIDWVLFTKILKPLIKWMPEKV